MPRERPVSEEIKAKVDKIDGLKKTGISVEKACATVGVKSNFYYTQRSRLYGGLRPSPMKSSISEPKVKPTKPSYQAVPFRAPEKPGFELKGSPTEIAAFVAELSRQFGGEK